MHQATKILCDRKRFRRILSGCLLSSLLCGTAGFAAGSVELVSRANPRRPSDTASGSPFGAFPSPAISADGRWVAYLSAAKNLVTGQGDPARKLGGDVFLHDRVSGATLLAGTYLGAPSAACCC